MSNFRYWIASFPPSPASKLTQIQFWPGPGVPNQLMTRWWVTVLGLLGIELASARLQILLLGRRNPGRKWGTRHPKSRSTIWLLTHPLLQLMRKVPREGSIPADPTGRLNLNLPLCLGPFFLLHPSYRTPWDIFLDSSTKAPESSDEIPNGEDNPSPSGTKSSPHLSKALSP
jgi:hypothetical protein